MSRNLGDIVLPCRTVPDHLPGGEVYELFLRDDDLLSIDHSMLRIQSFARLASIAGHRQIARPAATDEPDG